MGGTAQSFILWIHRKYGLAEIIWERDGLHKVDVAHAQASAVELQQEFIRALQVVSKITLVEFHLE